MVITLSERGRSRVVQARFQAIVFDLYETLVTELDPDWHPGTTPAERLGVRPEVFEEVWRAYAHRRMTRRVDHRDVLREVCQAGGLVVGPGTDEVIADLYSERLAAKADALLKVERSVLESLSQLRALGLRLGLVSNCSVEEVAAWDRSPLAPLFDDVVFSYCVGRAKPDPTIYLMACQRLRVLPERTAFVGDGGSAELDGAARVGMSPFCARWFLDRWPAWRRYRTAQSSARFRQLSSLTELVSFAAESVTAG